MLGGGCEGVNWATGGRSLWRGVFDWGGRVAGRGMKADGGEVERRMWENNGATGGGNLWWGVFGWGGMAVVGREEKKRMEARWNGECGRINGAAGGGTCGGEFLTGEAGGNRSSGEKAATSKVRRRTWGCKGSGVYGGSGAEIGQNRGVVTVRTYLWNENIQYGLSENNHCIYFFFQNIKGIFALLFAKTPIVT